LFAKLNIIISAKILKCQYYVQIMVLSRQKSMCLAAALAVVVAAAKLLLCALGVLAHLKH